MALYGGNGGMKVFSRTCALAAVAFFAGCAVVAPPTVTEVRCAGTNGSFVVRADAGQLASWTLGDGTEALFLPRRRPWRVGEVHGGVPICWPWFGRKSDDLPMHGLARYAQWTVTGTDGANVLRLRLDSSEATRRIWPYDFSLTCTVFLLETNRIEVAFTETNTDRRAYETSWGFHPYLAVASADDVEVDGVSPGRPYVRVSTKDAGGHARVLSDVKGGREIEVSCSDNEDWFVWNPGAEVTAKCRTLDADDWRRFYCLEPCTLTPRVLKPGESRTHRLRLAVRARPESAPCQSGPTSSRKLTHCMPSKEK